MIFLDDTPPGVRDRWKQGAKMCAAWGIPCSGASVWRLYRSYVLEWRLRLAHEASADIAQPGDTLDEKTARLVAHRTFEVLANPHSPAPCLLGLARIELRQRSLEFARQKHWDNQQSKTERLIDAFSEDIGKNHLARAVFHQLLNLIHPEEPYEEKGLSPS